MNAISEITEVHWVSDSKDRVMCIVSYEDGTAERLSVGISDDSVYWQRILQDHTVEQIDEFTNEIKQIQRDKRKVNEYREQERDAQKKMNALFNAKIEAFELPAVSSASSATKSKIRKAKSVTEVIARVAACIIESEKANG